ncbi:hypothetical protein [Streptomyces sp. NPDC047939]|uniref:hypothetical protein n=1 Tax=Streptomyces sp. NPDC047939 TaxID=3155381 RepID=UPI003423B5FD
MIIVYTPKDGEREDYDARSLLSSEAAIVARAIDQKWPEIKTNLVDDDLDAMRGVVWVLKKRHQPTLRFDDFDPGVEELVSRYDKTEVETLVDRTFAILDTESVDLEHVLLALREAPDVAADPEHARAYIEKLRAEVEDAAATGKDSGPEADPTPASTPESTTSTPSTFASSELSTSDSSLSA